METKEIELRLLRTNSGQIDGLPKNPRKISKKINVLSIEKEPGKNKMALCGDNMKFIDSLDLSRFDINFYYIQ